MYRLIPIILLACTSISADVLETTSKLYDKKVEVILEESKDYADKLVGIIFYEVIKDGEIGSNFFRQITFYTVPPNNDVILKEDNIFRATGYLAKNIIEINEINISIQWKVDKNISTKFQKVINQFSKGTLSEKQQIEIYTLLVNGFPFTNGGKQIHREELGNRDHKWILGKELISGKTINLHKSVEYGNRFTASFIDE